MRMFSQVRLLAIVVLHIITNTGGQHNNFNLLSEEIESLSDINGERISCYFCEYAALKSVLIGKGRTDKGAVLDEMLQAHHCITERRLKTCAPGIRSCALSISEEKFRVRPEDKTYLDSAIKVSHFCGNVGETATSCEWSETNTLGVAVSCTCGGTSCNDRINASPALRASSMIVVAALITAVFTSQNSAI